MIRECWTRKMKKAWNAGYEDGASGSCLTMNEFDDDYEAKARARGWHDGVVSHEMYKHHKKGVAVHAK